MARIGVTGSSGFIGSAVTAYLAARGDTVVRVTRPFEYHALVNTFASVDVVIHLAGVVASTRTADFHAANVDATRIVARAAVDTATPMVHVSSLAAAGPASPSRPRLEDDVPAPINAYGRSKLDGERAVIATRDLQWTILRPGVVYGPGDRAMRPLFAYARRGFLPLVGNPSAAYMFIYIDDAVRAIAAAADRECTHDTIFVAHERPISPRTLLETIRAAVNPSARLVPVPRAAVRVAALAGDCAGALTRRPATINSHRYVELYARGFVCRVDRLTERLGVTPTIELADGIRRTLAS